MVERDDGLTDFSGVSESHKAALDDSLSDVIDVDSIPDTATTLSDGAEISEAGDYILSGSYTQPITIDVSGGYSIVHIYLNNADITTSTNAPIYSTGKKGTLVITAVSGTTNSLSNTATDDDDATDENGIRAKSNIVINGTGTLSISSASGSAIKTSKGLVVSNTTLDLTAENSAIRADGFVYGIDSTINTSSTGDGIHAEIDSGDDQEEFTKDAGYVYLEDTSYAYSGYGDGIQADSFVYLNGGTFDISTTGTFVSYSEDNKDEYDLTDDDFRYVKSGDGYEKTSGDDKSTSNKYALANSVKGIKLSQIEYDDDNGDTQEVDSDEYLVLIYGVTSGTFDTQDDSVNTSAGSIVVDDSSITIDSYDQGLNATDVFQSSGSALDISSSYEGIQARKVELTGGTESVLNITSSDDAINAASDTADEDDIGILVNGGYLTTVSGGDGLDSNGWMEIDGGVSFIQASTDDDNSALDYEDGITINGGVIGAFGSLGMVETPSTNSTQDILVYGDSNGFGTNTPFSIVGSDGITYFSETLVNEYESAIVSFPGLTSGSTYEIQIGGESVESFTVSSEPITSLGDSSREQNNGGPGRGNGGLGGR